MGAILGKNKPLSISKNINGKQEKQVTTISNNHTNKTTTLEKKTKKKATSSNKNPSDAMVDKCTSTDGEVISSSAYIKKLVAGVGCNRSYDSLNAQNNSRRQSDAPSKDVLEFRDACIRRGIITPEPTILTTLTSTEQDEQVNTENTVKESNKETSTTVVTNNEQQFESQTTSERDD